VHLCFRNGYIDIYIHNPFLASNLLLGMRMEMWIRSPSMNQIKKRFQTEDEDENMEERETFTTLPPSDPLSFLTGGFASCLCFFLIAVG